MFFLDRTICYYVLPCLSFGLGYMAMAAEPQSLWPWTSPSHGLLVNDRLTHGFYVVPSGKRLHNELENHYFQWVNQLFLWPFALF